MRYLIRMSYDGSKFYGFQRLNNNLSVQGELEKALSKIAKEKVEVKGAGRTDRNVHALDQCAHFDLKKEMAPSSLIKAINRYTSKYLIINDCVIVDADFHARFSVKQKTYLYKIYVGKKDAFNCDYSYQATNSISLKKLKEVAKVFVGIHDYKNFVSGTHENTVGTIFDIKVKRCHDYVLIYFTGKSFYRYMVRNIMGAMLDYNKDKVDLIEIKKMLKYPNEKKQLSTAPAEGLYLISVKY